MEITDDEAMLIMVEDIDLSTSADSSRHDDMGEEIDVFDLQVSALTRPCANKRMVLALGAILK